MNIGVLVDGLGKKYKRTGISNYTHEVLRQLSIIDSSNKYFLFSNDDVILGFELPNNWKVIIDRSSQRALWQIFKTGKLARRYHIDILWSPTHVLPLLPPKSCKYVMTIHDLANIKFKNIDQNHINGIILNYALKKAARIADRIIAVSEATKDDIIDLCKVPENKIKVIYEGSVLYDIKDLVNVNNIETYNKYHIKERYLLFVSTLQPRKNISVIVEAYIRYKDISGSAIQLVLAGGKGWGVEDVLNRINECKYKDDIVLTGYISEQEKMALYEGCTAFVYPSLYEGFGIPVLEAMKFGKPVITSRVSSLPEVGGDIAFYIDDPKNYKALADQMIVVTQLDQQSIKTIEEKSIAHEKKFTWEKCAIETMELLSELLPE